jgi:hypothetical protein
MELQNIKIIAHLKEYAEQTNFQISNDNRKTIILTGSYTESKDVLEDELHWRIWKNDEDFAGRYTFQSDMPHIVLFKEKKETLSGVEKKYTSGIVFKVNFIDTIKKITFSDGKIDVEVFEDSYYWQYDRNKKQVSRNNFDEYVESDNFIISKTSTQMDSQSPSHQGVIRTGFGLKY